MRHHNIYHPIKRLRLIRKSHRLLTDVENSSESYVWWLVNQVKQNTRTKLIEYFMQNKDL